jgi:hypothetical protein
MASSLTSLEKNELEPDISSSVFAYSQENSP